ncbi:MAG: DUF4112 domain-containing protein [Asticcacaulis sp.]|nr:DUF4112 domain-containing protein [Asticcacaulis sp.]
MQARTQHDIQRIYDSIESIKRLSDRIIGIGPLNIIGLDGILALVPIPGVGTAYSVIAGLILLVQGMRARVTPATMVVSFIILLLDSGLTTVEDLAKFFPPLAWIPGLMDAFFQGHLYAAHMMQKDIEKTLYVEGTYADGRQSGEHDINLAEMRATKGKKRIVYLG